MNMADDVAPGDGDVSKSTLETKAAETDREDNSATEEAESTAVGEEKADARNADGADGNVADEVEDGIADEADNGVADFEEAAPGKPRSHVRMALIAGLMAVVVLAGLTGWTGYRAYNSYQGEKQRQLFLEVGKQGALNLTTIDWKHAEADVQRVLDSSTGTFYDDFQNRASPFVEVVKQAQSKSVGSISEAGLESESKNGAQVLVAVTVNTSNAGAPEQQPRSWRMRVSVEKVGEDAKVSNVEFVP
jgi:Mce-associated membrane protein